MQRKREASCSQSSAEGSETRGGTRASRPPDLPPAMALQPECVGWRAVGQPGLRERPVSVRRDPLACNQLWWRAGEGTCRESSSENREPAAERGRGIMRINSCQRTGLWAYLSSPAQVGFCWQSLGSPARNSLTTGANWGAAACWEAGPPRVSGTVSSISLGFSSSLLPFRHKKWNSDLLMGADW